VNINNDILSITHHNQINACELSREVHTAAPHTMELDMMVLSGLKKISIVILISSVIYIIFIFQQPVFLRERELIKS